MSFVLKKTEVKEVDKSCSINEVVDIYRHRSDNNYFINISFLMIFFYLENNIYQNIYEKLFLGVWVKTITVNSHTLVL